MAICMNVAASRLLVDGRSDPEYFLPQHTAVASELNALPTLQLRKIARLSCSAFYPAATHLYANDGIPFLRCVDAVDFPILAPDQPFARIPATFASAHGTIRTLEAGDIVITKVGTPCYASLLSDDMPPSAMTRTVLGASGVDREVVDPYYLVAFLRSRYGFDQLMRERELTIQYQLTLERTRKIRIVVPERTVQTAIGNMMRDYFRALRQSVDHFSSARELLETELGLDKISFKKPLGHATTFSATMQAGRIDADYFQPPFLQMDAHLAQCPTTPLHALAEIKKGIEVGSAAYQAEGRPFLRVSNIKEPGIELGASDKYISPERYAMLREFKPLSGEVLLTKDGSPGVALAVDQEIDGIVSGGVVRLVPRNSNVPIEYLALAINSMACRMQVERECSGALIVHWKPSSIRKLRIPLLSDGKMRTIADRVTQAKLAKRKSRELLEQAKHRVEEMIERAVHQ